MNRGLSEDSRMAGIGEGGTGETILEVSNIRKYFPVRGGLFGSPTGWARAVDGVSFRLRRETILGLVGEIGCGKSTLGKAIAGIIRRDEGAVFLGGRQVGFGKEAKDLRREIQYIYQDPGASLDPWWIIGWTLREPLRVHTNLSRSEIDERVMKMVRAVGLSESHLVRYPHEFSGGQQRRLGLARVLMLNPRVIIFDEPTSGLDVSVQATILKLFLRLKGQFHLSYLFISHDLSVIRMICHEVAVMYLGKIVEMGDTKSIFEHPMHPYTKFLLSAIPEIWDEGKQRRTLILSGEPPSPDQLPPGCRFQNRCPLAGEECRRSEPELVEREDGHRVACFHSSRVERIDALASVEQ
jgi:oligopeptide/dipeptide ABC transporter ATP-binding protein